MLRVRLIAAATIAALLALWGAPCLTAAPAGHAAMPCCRASHDGGSTVRPCCAGSESHPALPPASTATALPALSGIAASAIAAPVLAPLDRPAPSALALRLQPRLLSTVLLI